VEGAIQTTGGHGFTLIGKLSVPGTVAGEVEPGALETFAKVVNRAEAEFKVGGDSLWLMDAVAAEIKKMNQTTSMFGFGQGGFEPLFQVMEAGV